MKHPLYYVYFIGIQKDSKESIYLELHPNVHYQAEVLQMANMALSYILRTEYLTFSPRFKTNACLHCQKECFFFFFYHCCTKRLSVTTYSFYTGYVFILIYCVKHSAYQLESVMVCYWPTGASNLIIRFE